MNSDILFACDNLDVSDYLTLRDLEIMRASR